jgi:hypothetical protein
MGRYVVTSHVQVFLLAFCGSLHFSRCSLIMNVFNELLHEFYIKGHFHIGVNLVA